jgi:NAD(P)-dependent dehydrogenase (short-subunit alcohol dehydrogenase family)
MKTSYSSASIAAQGSLAGKNYVVTGGSTGIGLAAAELLIREGARVFITGRNQASLDDAKQRLGEGAVVVRGDTADLDALAELTRVIRSHVERLDGAFINAGVAVFGPLETVTPEQYDHMFDVNVRGAFFAVQALLPLLGQGSSIVFNSSVAGRLAMPGTAAYSATKAALTSLGRTLAVELAPRGIRVNTLSPGPVETPILDKVGIDAATRNDFAGRTLVKRLGRPEEVARLARFLLTDDSSFIVGEEVVVDGGIQLV